MSINNLNTVLCANLMGVIPNFFNKVSVQPYKPYIQATQTYIWVRLSNIAHGLLPGVVNTSYIMHHHKMAPKIIEGADGTFTLISRDVQSVPNISVTRPLKGTGFYILAYAPAIINSVSSLALQIAIATRSKHTAKLGQINKYMAKFMDVGICAGSIGVLAFGAKQINNRLEWVGFAFACIATAANAYTLAKEFLPKCKPSNDNYNQADELP